MKSLFLPGSSEVKSCYGNHSEAIIELQQVSAWMLRLSPELGNVMPRGNLLLCNTSVVWDRTISLCPFSCGWGQMAHIS